MGDMEGECLLQPQVLKIRVPSKGSHFVSGLASSYDEYYYPDELSGIVSAEELKDIIRRLNDAILSFWPCTTILAIGYLCIPCTLGVSLLCPQMCVGEAEIAAHKFLEQQTHKAKFFDRKISFRLVKRSCSNSCSNSFIEISVPQGAMLSDKERGGGGGGRGEGVNDLNLNQPIVFNQPPAAAAQKKTY
jgi:hypothetical protein